MGTDARWKSTRARKRFIWPVVTRLRRSRATSSTFLKRPSMPRPEVAERKTMGAQHTDRKTLLGEQIGGAQRCVNLRSRRNDGDVAAIAQLSRATELEVLRHFCVHLRISAAP